MKNKILSTLTACTIVAGTLMSAPTASAETHYKPHVAIGGHAGMTLSRMSFSPSVPQGWASGVTMGVQASYSEERLVGVVGELNFSQHGWKEQFDDNPGLSYKRTLNYIELPVMTHIYFGPSRCKFFFAQKVQPEIRKRKQGSS